MDTDMIDERKLAALLNQPEVRKAMRIRCEMEGRHDYVGHCSAAFRVYMACRWCGEER